MSKRQKKHLYRSIIICSFLAVIIVAVTAGILFTVNSNNKDSAANHSSYESATSTDAVPSSASDNSTYSSDSVSSFVGSSASVSSSVISTVSSLPSNQVGTASNGDTSTEAKHVCYLTFDDGPSKTVTPRILETLDKYNVKATFFVVGTSYLDNLQQIKDAGHSIGLHSDTHKWSIYKNADAYFDDLQTLSDKVYERIGIRVKMIRFPGGSSNTKSKEYSAGIMTKLTKMVTDKGYIYVDWNVSSGDADKNNVPKDTIVNNVLKGAVKKNGEPYKNICVLMHDLGTKSTTADALPEIIEGLRALGYTFEGLNENSPIFHHKVNN